MAVELNDALLAKIAGWDTVKRARSLLSGDRVLSSDWNPPLLKGIVQDGVSSYRAGLVIKSAVDVENLCSCKQSREWGTICAHSVAVGLHFSKGHEPATGENAMQTVEPVKPGKPESTMGRGLRLASPEAGGEPAELHVIIPPNFEQALARGKAMLCFEGSWRGRTVPTRCITQGAGICLFCNRR